MFNVLSCSTGVGLFDSVSHLHIFLFKLMLLFLRFKMSEVLNLLNFHCCNIFLAAASLLLISLWIALNYSWFVLLFNKDSLVLISVVVAAIVLSQNWTISFIGEIENRFSLEYQLSRKFWSWFPIVGSSISSSPFGTRPSVIQRDKNS